MDYVYEVYKILFTQYININFYSVRGISVCRPLGGRMKSTTLYKAAPRAPAVNGPTMGTQKKKLLAVKTKNIFFLDKSTIGYKYSASPIFLSPSFLSSPSFCAVLVLPKM